MSWVLVALGAWALGWWGNTWLAASPLSRTRGGKLAVPVIFGLTVLLLWEGLVRGLNVSPVILPPPSDVVVRLAHAHTRWDRLLAIVEGNFPVAVYEPNVANAWLSVVAARNPVCRDMQDAWF